MIPDEGNESIGAIRLCRARANGFAVSATTLVVLLASSQMGLGASCSFPLSQPAGFSCDGLIVSAGQSGVVANAGNIGNSTTTTGVDNFGTITTLTNSAGGTITGGSRDGITIESTGTIGALNNDGKIVGLGGSGIYNTSSSATTFTIRNGPSGNISGEGAGILLASSNTTEIINQGLIGGLLEGILNIGSGTVSIRNSGSIAGSPFGIFNDRTGNIAIIANSGVIGSVTALNNAGVIGSLLNSGSITAPIQNSGQIGTLTNTGTIQSSGINNYGSLSVLNNGQGASGQASALGYIGALPSFYNVIVASTAYGQLSATSATGAMSFGVFTGDPGNNIAASSPQARTRYAAVLSGVGLANLNTLAGSYNGLPWKLVLENGSQTTWDLVIGPFAPSVSKTLTAFASNRDAIRNALQLQSAVLANVTDYDCAAFDRFGFCISFQGRYTNSGGGSDGAGVLTAAYRLNDHVRIGGFIDYRVGQSKASGLSFGNDVPTLGGFIGFAQNMDGTGLQGKFSAAYNSTNLTVMRTPIGDGEPGVGSTGVRSYVFAGQLGWGFSLAGSLLATPYVGLRYTTATRGGYTEGFNALVQYPVSYNPYYERITTVLAGARLNGTLTDRIGYQAAVGAEVDAQASVSAYAGTNAIPGLEVFAIEHGGTAHRVRPAASASLSYMLAQNHNLIASVSLRGQAYSAAAALTTLVGYRTSF